LWEYPSGVQVSTIAGGAPGKLAFSPDGTILAAAGYDQTYGCSPL